LKICHLATPDDEFLADIKKVYLKSPFHAEYRWCYWSCQIPFISWWQMAQILRMIIECMYVCMYVCMYIIRLGVTSLRRTSLITKCMYVHSNAYICTYAFWCPCVKAHELIQNRVARFFLVEHTKTAINIPNDHTIHQMAVKFTQWP
jgi:hypothetical protein